MYNKKIYTTYRDNFTKLSEVKKFHLASRLSLQGDLWARQQIEHLRDGFLGGSHMSDYKAKISNIGDSVPNPKHVNAAKLRIPIFESHPWLFGYELQLFQILHAKTQYSVDLLHLLEKPIVDIDDAIKELCKNPSMLATLSTYLVDVFYLHNRIVRRDEESLISLSHINRALDIPLNDNNKARLSVYLLTHCIIGETLFYSRDIPTNKIPYYRVISALLHDIATKEWEHLTIDSKLEIALCLKLTKFKSTLVSKAIQDADEKYDEAKGFIIDPAVPHKNDLEWAEHRNVLYLLVTHNAG